jgi:preprotein translocase SecE subunit
MADEKATPKAAKGKVSVFSKVINFIKNLPARIAKPFTNMWHELQKVTWPTRKDLINYTIVVIIFMAFMGVVIGLLDIGSSALIAAMIG